VIDFDTIAYKHWAWVERMGWHNKTVLESLALIASEIGEATAECYDVIDLTRLGEELADIILRCVDLARTEKVDLTLQVINARPEWRGITAPERMGEVLVEYACWSNTARKPQLGPDFGEGMGRLVARVVYVADLYGIDLEKAVQLKLAKNEINGTRGRPI
jgi:NTP pyrophosphatase (non-canonical NTP hydrolase)